MPVFDVRGTMEDLTDDILDSIIDEIKLIERIQNMTLEAKMRMFQVYFRGLKDGLKIASGNILNEEDPMIRIIDNDIIGKIITGKLSDKEAWHTMLTFVTK